VEQLALKDLFSTANCKKKKGKKKGEEDDDDGGAGAGGGGKRKGKGRLVEIVDPRRSNNVSIMLKQFEKVFAPLPPMIKRPEEDGKESAVAAAAAASHDSEEDGKESAAGGETSATASTAAPDSENKLQVTTLPAVVALKDDPEFSKYFKVFIPLLFAHGCLTGVCVPFA
jgi:hypothetical protein